MLTYLRTYSSIFLLFPLIYVGGNLFEPISYLILMISMGFWMSKGQDNVVIIAMLFILILGDSRAYDLLFMKNLRILGILLITFRTVYEIAKGKYRFNYLILFALPFFVISFFGSLRNPQIGTSMAKMFSYFFLLFIVLHYFPHNFRKNKGQLILDIAYSSLVVFALGLMFVIVNPGLVFLVGRYRGLLGNPNGLGLYATVVFPIVLIALDLFSEQKNEMSIVLIFLIISVLLCRSRTALGTIGIFYMLHFFYRRSKIATTSLWLIVIPSIALFFAVVDLKSLAYEFGLGEYLRIESIATGTGRFLAWGLGWNEILENPWIGRGFAYESHFFHELAEMLLMTEHQGGIHNSYLTFLMNNGFIGFTFFVIFLIAIFRTMKNRAFKWPFIIAMLISANFESWLNSSLNAFTIHFLITIIIIMLYPELKLQTQSTDP